jgi:N-acetyl sugar amidotransferase
MSNKIRLKYCTKCLLPSTKPHLSFNENGVCDACSNYNSRDEVDWEIRKKELDVILDRYRSQDGYWDCVVPVSGGKDSTYQVLKMLEFGMTPLCVTSTTCDLSEIGRRNIENIKKLGVDYIEFSPNPVVRAKLNRLGLDLLGDISWPEHIGINTIPIRVAVQYGIKLVVWGENSQNEYGGPAAASESNVLTWEWLTKFAGFVGLRVSDVVEMEGFSKKDLIAYTYPSNEDLKRVGVTGIFTGHYIPWDGLANTLLAQANGFEVYPKIVEGSVVNYENLDNHHTGIHDYFKFLKFGYGRATDIASMHIRRGRITREQGLKMVRENDGNFPWVYLGKELKDILSPLDMSIEEFTDLCDAYTNHEIFLDSEFGEELKKSTDGSLTKVNYDN